MAKRKEKITESTETVVKSVTSMKKKEAPITVTFDRWFALQGRPMHHKAGMVKYTNVNGKRTIETWDKVFKNY